MGLPSEAIVCIQGLNLTDTLIALLGCIRAGLVATIVPVDFAPDEIVGLAERLNAKAILSARKMGHDQPLRPLRHLVGGYHRRYPLHRRFRLGSAGRHRIFRGLHRLSKIRRHHEADAPRAARRQPCHHDRRPWPRRRLRGGENHREWHAAASVLVDELGLSRQSRLLSPMAPSNLSGLAGGLVAWLVSGCQLVLHQAFDATVFAVQMTMHGVTHVLLPDVALQAGLAEGLFSGRKLEKIASLTREPYRSATPAPAPCPVVAFAVLGEVGILPMRLEADGNFTLPGRIDTGSDGQAASVESTIEPGGHLALRGEQVPLVGFDISDRDLSYPVSPEEWVSTGYPAETASGGVRITGIRYGDGANRIFDADSNERT